MKLRTIASAVALATLATGTFAATSTGTMAVQANVVDSCIISGGTLNFGDVNVFGPDVNATTNLTARCTQGTLFTVGMGPGNAVGATTSTRAMMNTTAKLTYGLYTDAAWTLNWDDIAGTNVLPGTGTGADQLLPVYGKVPAGQTAILTGAYADVVNVTVNF